MLERPGQEPERFVHVERHLVDPVVRDQAADGDEAAVARRKAGPFPDISEQHIVGVFAERGRDIGERIPVRHWFIDHFGFLRCGIGSSAKR